MIKVKVIDIYEGDKIIQPLSYISFNKEDSIQELRQKILISYSKFISNEIMSLEPKRGSRDNSYIITNLIDELSNEILYNIETYNIDDITDKYSGIINNMYNILVKRYTSLTKDALVLTIKYILYHNMQFMFNDFRNIIDMWTKEVYDHKQNIINKYYLINVDIDTSILKEYIFFTNGDGHVFEYSIISSIIKYNSSSKSSTNLDYVNIIKRFPLDSITPIIYTTINKEIVIRYLKDLPKSHIKEWIFKDNTRTLKNIKGLILKIYISKDSYSTFIISKDLSKMLLRCSWNSSQKTTFRNLNTCTKNIPLIIKKIIYTSGVNDLIIERPIISSINIQFTIKKQLSFSKIKIGLKQLDNLLKLKNNITESTDNPTNKIYLTYTPTDTIIMIRNNKTIIDGIYTNTNLVDVINIKDEQNLFNIIKVVVRLFIISDKITPLIIKNGLLIYDTRKIETVITQKEIANIKKLRQYNIIKIDSTSCQKKRQPEKIMEMEPMKSSMNNNSSNKNFINYKNNKFICKNYPYIYPGFTNKNILCCFLKDQKDKNIYKKNLGLQINEDTSNIFKKNIITTNKILDNNRLGVLKDIFYNIFSKNNYYRLGNKSGDLLDIVNNVLNKEVTLTTLKEYIDNNNNIFKTVNHENITKSQYIQQIMTSNNDNIIDIISIYFKINIFVFNTDKNNILCRNNFIQFNKNIFISNTNNYYELIININSKDIIKKVFDNSDKISIEILNIYKESCIIKYIGYPTEPMTITDLKDLKDFKDLNIKNNIKINSQVINEFNNVIYINSNYGLLPVIPTNPLFNIKIDKLHKIDLRKQYDFLLKLKIDYLTPVAQLVDFNESNCHGILTKSGLIIPTLQGNRISALPMVFIQYTPDIDNVLYNNELPVLDSKYYYILGLKFYRELYERFRYTLSYKINKDPNIKKDIIDNKDNSKILRDIINMVLIDEIVFVDILKPTSTPSIKNICSNLSNGGNNNGGPCTTDSLCKNDNNKCKLAIEKNIYRNIVKSLAIDIINSNNIINGKIYIEHIDKDKFIRRPNEVILMTKEDIYKLLDNN